MMTSEKEKSLIEAVDQLRILLKMSDLLKESLINRVEMLEMRIIALEKSNCSASGTEGEVEGNAN
jgi:hypothetical protein